MHRGYLGRLKPEAEKRPRAQIIMKKVSQETEKRRKVLENDKNDAEKSAHQDEQKARTGELRGARAHRDCECLFSTGKAHDCIEAVRDCVGKPSVIVLSLEQQVVFSVFAALFILGEV